MKVLILSGGSGTRLWPASREAFPKQFIDAGNGKSLLANTYERALALTAVDELITVTNKNYFFFVADEYKNLKSATQNTYFLEPFGRNTAAPIALVAFYMLAKGQDEPLLVLPSDHVIENVAAFDHQIQQAIPLLEQGYLITFGIQPYEPKTGYGYIKAAKALANGAYEVERFVEKPDLANAEKFLAEGGYYWNSGMFLFKPSFILEAFKQHAPALLQSVEAVWQDIEKTAILAQDIYNIADKAFENIESISIDYAIMEHAAKVAVMPSSFKWSDVGCWNEYGNLFEQDLFGNKAHQDTVLIDVENTFVKADGKTVAAIGVKDLVVVDTKDVLLISHSQRVQDVKKVVEKLKAKNHPSYKEHQWAKRPWGEYHILEEAEHFKIKRIIVNPGAALSLQYHHHRSEHWVVVEGVAKVVNGDQEIILQQSQSTFIPKGAQHRLSNPGDKPLMIIEVQVGDYLGEDDIVRLEDQYGRQH